MMKVLRARPFLPLLIGGIIAIAAMSAWIYDYSGLYGFNVILRRGASYWVPVRIDDPRLSESMRIALRLPVPAVVPGPFSWKEIATGFEVAEMPVVADHTEVDRILLARIDPAHFRFVVRNAPAGNRELGDWMKQLGAALAINGSYFSRYGTPITPFLSAGTSLGPVDYAGQHGAFVASDGVTIRDLANEDWRTSFQNAHDALVSYPLLIGADGKSRAGADTGWLANRSFVAQDNAGRILFGTTKEAFFSLGRLADFLNTAELDLKLALNLDGGPVACQGVALENYRRDFCGDWEFGIHGGTPELLTGALGNRRWGLPVVIAVLPKQ